MSETDQLRQEQLDALIEASHALTHLLVELGRNRGRADALDLAQESPERDAAREGLEEADKRVLALADSLCLSMAAVARDEPETFEYLRSLLEDLT